MAVTLTVNDENVAGERFQQWALEVLAERITVRELIRSRVYQEVQDYNRKRPELFRGLVQPTDAEQTLNGFKLPKGRQIDWHDQYQKAIEAFERNRVIILVGERQAASLDEDIEIKPGTEVTFLRLVPLVGG